MADGGIATTIVVPSLARLTKEVDATIVPPGNVMLCTRSRLVPVMVTLSTPAFPVLMVATAGSRTVTDAVATLTPERAVNVSGPVIAALGTTTLIRLADWLTTAGTTFLPPA